MKTGIKLKILFYNYLQELTGNYFYYSFIVTYKDKGNREIFNYSCSLGLIRKEVLFQDRELKKYLGPLHKDINIKHLFRSGSNRNGKLSIRVGTYIGWTNNRLAKTTIKT